MKALFVALALLSACGGLVVSVDDAGDVVDTCARGAGCVGIADGGTGD